MGSLVLAKPMFDRLRKNYPEAAVHLLVFERNRTVLELLDLVPESHIVTIDDRSFTKFMVSCWRALARLRKAKIDTVIDCELFSRISSLLSLASGARVRVGFHAHTQEGLYRGGFINRPVLYNPYRHISLQFLAMADSIELHGRPLVKTCKDDEQPRVEPVLLSPEERERFYGKLHADFPQLMNDGIVLLYPGGGMLPIRAWPSASYGITARDLTAKGYIVGVIGMAEDRPLAREIRSFCGSERCVDLTGYTKNIKEVVFLLQKASLLIANDGGPGHFASLVSTPAIIFYGPETPLLYGVLKKDAHLFHLPLPCSPCLTAYNHRRSPCDGNNLCLRLLSPEVVLAKAYELMASSAPRKCSSGNLASSKTSVTGNDRPFAPGRI